MNQTINEQMSALMDGELERDQTRFLLKRMGDDADLPVRWARYHVARQTLRRQEVVLVAGFSDRVMAAIEMEPATFARPRHSWLRWGAGGAIAASVAVAALVLVQPQQAGPESPMVAARTGGQSASPSLVPAPVMAASASIPASAGSGFQPPMLVPSAPIETAPVSFGSDLAQPMVMDPRVQSYVLRHYQSAGPEGQAAMVPYVLLAVPRQEVKPQAAAQSR